MAGGDDELSTKECSPAGVLQDPIFHGDYSFNTGQVKTLTFVDYVIFVFLLAASMLIGAHLTWYNRKRLGIAEYLLAGRTMGTIPVAFSLFMCFTSAVTVMGFPSEMYHFGTMYIYATISYILIAEMISTIFIPVYYQLKITSIHEYLEMRFSRTVRVIAAILFIIEMVMYLGIVMSVPSVVLSQVAGLDPVIAILSVGIVGMLYTTAGGAKAVIWTDFFQGLSMILGELVILVYINYSLLSWDEVISSTKRTNRFVFDNLQFSFAASGRTGVWSVIAGGVSLFTGIFGSNQAMVSRCLTCHSLSGAKKAVWISCILMIVNTLILCALGLFMAAFYENCDPIQAKLIKKSNQLVPLFVMDATSNVAGVPGIFLLVISCGTLSTVSSGLSSMAIAVLEDFIRTFSSHFINDTKARRYSQFFSFFFGVICCEIAYLMLSIDDGLKIVIKLVNSFTGPMMGVFATGIIFPWVNNMGGLFGLLTSLVLGVLHIWAQKIYPVKVTGESPLKCLGNCASKILLNLTTQPAQPEPPLEQSTLETLIDISDKWTGIVFFLICIVLSLIVSLITGNLDPTTVDPRLIVPVTDVVFPFYYLPWSFRKILHFGLDHTDKWREQSTGKSMRTERSVDRFGSSVKQSLRTELESMNEDAAVQCDGSPVD